MKRVIKSSNQSNLTSIFCDYASSVIVGDIVKDDDCDIQFEVLGIQKCSNGILKFTTDGYGELRYDPYDQVTIVNK